MKRKKKTWIYIKYALIGLLICVTGLIYWLGHDFRMRSENMEASDTFSAEQESSENHASDEIQSNQEEMIYVYICGQIMNPGVVECSKGSRLFQLIELAGGATEEADESQLNLAEVLHDGQKVYVPAAGESLEQMTGIGSTGVSGMAEGSKVNINHASKEELMTLSGIGESRALDIIAYRTEHGEFAAIEEIKKVSGIKDAAYAKIKDSICV